MSQKQTPQKYLQVVPGACNLAWNWHDGNKGLNKFSHLFCSGILLENSRYAGRESSAGIWK